jgi:trimeric autotransporter adhesin
VTSITALSDARDKKDINDLELGLDYIQQLRPVSWIWDARDGSRVGTKDFGFIAQDLQKAQEDNGAPWVNAVLESNPERLEAAPGKLLPIAIKAIQELSEQVQLMKSSLNEQARQAARAAHTQSHTITRLQAEIATLKSNQ